MKRLVSAFIGLVALTHGSTAGAHPPPFWWMADLSMDRRAGVEMSFGNPDLGIAETTTFAGSLFADIGITSAIALQARLPLAFVDFDPGLAGEGSETIIGNVSLGLQAAGVHGGGHTRTLFGGGLALYLPTASDGAAAAGAAGAAGQLYLPDPGRWLVDTTTVRLRGDVRVEAGAFFLQTELDLDFHIVDGEDDVNLVAALGPGVSLTPHFALLLEAAVSEIADNEQDEQFTLDLGFRYHTPVLMLGARFYLPLSDPYRDLDVFGVGLDISGRF